VTDARTSHEHALALVTGAPAALVAAVHVLALVPTGRAAAVSQLHVLALTNAPPEATSASGVVTWGASLQPA
jgi:hypothetical protein